LRQADQLYVQLVAPTKAALDCGCERVKSAMEAVTGVRSASPSLRAGLEVYRAAPQPAPQPAPAEQIVVPLPAAAGPPPAWGRSAPAPAAAPSAGASAAGHAAGEECTICCSGAVSDVRFDPCNHAACSQCVVDLRKRSLFLTTAGVPCPWCRAIITRYDAPPGVDVGLQARGWRRERVALAR
jgi:hypothetical protein